MKICILTDENKKEAAARLCAVYCGTLCRHSVCVSGSAAPYIEETAGISVSRLMSVNDGGIEQLTQLCVCGETDMVIYLRDASPETEDSPEFTALMRACDFYGIPVATGLATAEMLLYALSRRENAKFMDRPSGSRSGK